MCIPPGQQASPDEGGGHASPDEGGGPALPDDEGGGPTLPDAQMDESELTVGRGEVPIGQPLLGTCIELRTEDDGLLEGCGQGEIWIGEVVGGARF